MIATFFSRSSSSSVVWRREIQNKMARIPKQRNMQQIYKKRTWKKHSQARYLMCSVQFPAFVLQL